MKKTKIIKPIIIIGIERSGKSLLFNILANHPDIYWLSNLDSKCPTGTIPITLIRRIYSSKVNRCYTMGPGTISIPQGGIIYPSECLSYWKKVFRWGNEENYLIASDYFDERNLTTELCKRLIDDLCLRVLLSGGKRLMVEQAGFSLKILFFNALFPDAIFLHIVRNPFDNHDALVRRKLSSDQKLWGIKVPGWKELTDKDLSTQAAMQLKFTLKIIEEDIVKIPNFETRYKRIQYENLVSMPKETIQSVLDFCNLDMTPQVLAALTGVRKETKDQHGTGYHISQETLEVLISLAQQYGYLNF